MFFCKQNFLLSALFFDASIRRRRKKCPAEILSDGNIRAKNKDHQVKCMRAKAKFFEKKEQKITFRGRTPFSAKETKGRQ